MTLELHLEKQWKDWQDKNLFTESIDFDQVRNAIITDLELMSAMDVREYTLFQKYHEIQEKFPSITVKPLWEDEIRIIKDESQRRLIQKIKNNIWIPTTDNDYLNLEPELIHVKINAKVWNCLRVFSSTMKNSVNIGRNLNFLVRDKITKKYLGTIAISSDFMELKARDDYIGWSRDVKTFSGKLNNIAICSTIIPTQPLGHNYVGGKLLALLCLSDDIQNIWQQEYGDILVGLTTTSLYGKTKSNGLSQYDNLKYWKKLGFSVGSIAYEPTKNTLKMMMDYFKINHSEEYFKYYIATNLNGQPLTRCAKNRGIHLLFRKFNIPKELIETSHARGIYFSTLYDNTREFLKEEITETDLVKSFDTSVESLTDIWKNKYAKKRIESLIKQDRKQTDVLFYDDVITKSWEETKATYLEQVGR